MADSSPGLAKRASVLLGNIPVSLSDPTVCEFVQEHGLSVERSHRLEERKRLLITVSGSDEGDRVLPGLMASVYPLIRNTLARVVSIISI